MIRNMKRSYMERFDSFVMPEPMSGCFLWIGGTDADGYGCFWYEGKTVKAHKMSWIMNFGSIPDNQCVLHKCDNPPCINPNHLFLGSNKDNTQDSIKKNRRAIFYGDENPVSKLTSTDVALIRTSKTKQQILAKELGVTRSLISMVRNRKIWRHIP